MIVGVNAACGSSALGRASKQLMSSLPNGIRHALAEAVVTARASPHVEKVCLTLVLAALAAALVYQAWRVGVTVDEPAHLLSAFLYWRGEDTLLPRELPPLIKIVGGWAPTITGLPLPYDHPSWRDRHEWTISLVMMERMKADQIRKVFFLARLSLLIFPLLTALLLWRWGRELFGAWTGMLIALAFALEPTALAHGALFKNDLAATFGYLAFWYGAWKFWRQPTPGLAACVGLALLAAVLAKLSMLILAPVAPLLVLLRCASRPRQAVTCLLLVLAIPYLGSIVACQLEAQPLTSEELAATLRDPRLPAPLRWASPLFRVVPVPIPLWQGLVSLAHSNATENRVYFWGRIYPGGHPLYFPGAILVKTPLAILLLLLCGTAILCHAALRGRLRGTHLFWLVPGLLYIGLASLSSLQLGVRLVLPALPFGLLLCGTAIQWLNRGRGKVFLALLLASLAAESASIYPHGISFFNLAAGGPEQGLRYLADSNLDWGQSLRDLAGYVRKAGIKKFRLSYFGSDNPWAYFSDQELELLPPPWDPSLVPEGRLVYRPQPGYYAISATLFPGHFFEPRYRDYYGYFRGMEPIAKVGYSIYVYRVDESWHHASRRCTFTLRSASPAYRLVPAVNHLRPGVSVLQWRLGRRGKRQGLLGGYKCAFGLKCLSASS